MVCLKCQAKEIAIPRKNTQKRPNWFTHQLKGDTEFKGKKSKRAENKRKIPEKQE